uniref:EGF-like domain-containing protein n=1 Tax=Octopus bimaculoides TaxID=37653 RepID=A0A0L8H966_OCTBM
MVVAVSGCSKRKANLFNSLVKCFLFLTFVELAISIRFYEICEVGECKNGGTMYWPDTFLGMCKCICPYPYVGALCQNTRINPRKLRSKRRRDLVRRGRRSLLINVLMK